MLDRVQLKLEAREVVRSAKVSAYLFTLLALVLTLILNGASDYMTMDDMWAYDYSLRTGLDLSFLALHPSYPTILVLFVSVVASLTGTVLGAGEVLYHLGVRRGEEMPYTTLFDGFSFAGKNAVVLGRSNIVGKPMARMLLARSCNVTVLHSKTSEEDKAFYLAHADLIVVAIGKQGFLDRRFVYKPTAIVVDVGINRGEDGHLHGDAIPGLPVALQTPGPGGVGLLTRLALMENILEAHKE